jgi:hypothetical protein
MLVLYPLLWKAKLTILYTLVTKLNLLGPTLFHFDYH